MKTTAEEQRAAVSDVRETHMRRWFEDATTDVVEAHARAAVAVLRARGVALDLPADEGHESDALSAIGSLATSARTVEALAEEPASNDTGE